MTRSALYAKLTGTNGIRPALHGDCLQLPGLSRQKMGVMMMNH